MEFNIADIFESVADRIPDRVALYAEGRRLTYAELDARATRLANHLAAQGVGAGDHVGCHMKNGTEYLETMIACFKIRAVPVNVNFRYVQEELRYLCDDADLVAVVSDTEFLDRLAAVRGDLPGLAHVLVMSPPGEQPTGLPEWATPYEDALAGADATRDFGPRSPDDLMIIYTGGTTGMPKGVMWRHEDIFFAGMLGASPGGEDPVTAPEQVADRAEATGGFIATFPAAPLMHGAAELASFITFWLGGKVVLIRDYSGEGAVDLIAQERPLSISLVGDAMVQPLVDALAATDKDVSSLLSLGSAGAILSQTTRDRLTAIVPNINISDAFGASEVGYSGSMVEGSNPETGLKFQPNPYTAVVSDDFQLIAPGSEQVGNIAQKGHVPLGYYKDEEKTAKTFVEIDGARWAILGDRGTIDADGIIHFLGRGSVCINSGGEKIFPEEVEAALKAHPSIQDAVVAGIPDERWGQKVTAVIQPVDGVAAPTQDEIEEHLATRIARYKVPRLTVAVDEMQRSPSGKPDYKWAAAQATAAAGTPVS